MKKRMMGLVAAGAAAVLMLSGFDSAMTASDLQDNALNAVMGAQQCTVSFAGSADVSLIMTQEGEGGDQMTVPAAGEMTGTYRLSMDPLAIAADVSFSGSAMGQGGSGSMEMYLIENEDGTGNAYMYAAIGDQPGSWQATAVDAESMAQVHDAMDKVKSGDLDAFLDAYVTEDSGLNADQMKELIAKVKARLEPLTQLSPEPVDVNGKECYELVTDLTGDALYGVVEDAAAVVGEAIPDEFAGIAQMITGAIRIAITNDYEAETCYPIAGTVDLTGCDFEQLGAIAGQMMGAGDASITVDVKELGMNYTADYETPVEITVPEEALAAPVSEAGLDDIAGLAGAAGGMIGAEDGDSDDYDGQDGEYDPTAEATVNDDGSYHLSDTTYDGEDRAADVTGPAGMELSMGDQTFLAFTTEDYMKSVSYSLITYATAEEEIADYMDVSWKEEDDSYSEIVVADPVEITLENGNTFTYVVESYKYDEYTMIDTKGVVTDGVNVVTLNADYTGEDYNAVEVPESDLVSYAEAVSFAG